MRKQTGQMLINNTVLKWLVNLLKIGCLYKEKKTAPVKITFKKSKAVF